MEHYKNKPTILTKCLTTATERHGHFMKLMYATGQKKLALLLMSTSSSVVLITEKQEHHESITVHLRIHNTCLRLPVVLLLQPGFLQNYP